MRIIIINHEPYRTYMRDDFFMDDFIRDGYEVEFWSVHKVLNYSKNVEYKICEQASDVTYINSKSELQQRLSDIGADSIVCLEIWYNWDTYSIFKTINRNKIPFFSIDYFINYPEKREQLKKLRQSLRRGHFGRIFKALAIKIKSKIFTTYTELTKVQNSPLVFIPGCRIKYLPPARKVVSITHFDDYKFSAAKQNTSWEETFKDCIVFLDDMMPFHPDLKRLNTESINPDLYYKKLNNFFDFIEEQTGRKVIIAAHPKSAYNNEFGSRLCIKNRTAELVIMSSMVIAHHTTSINFAVLAYKKICLIYTNEFLNPQPNNYILEYFLNIMRGYEECINCPVVNIDDRASFEPRPVDEQLYTKFVAQFIRSEFYPDTNYHIVKRTISNT